MDAHVKNLRRKLGEDPKKPRYVLTVTGVGYKFGVKPDA
jgi:DNA-binding response OmpR family regulator